MHAFRRYIFAARIACDSRHILVFILRPLLTSSVRRQTFGMTTRCSGAGVAAENLGRWVIAWQLITLVDTQHTCLLACYHCDKFNTCDSQIKLRQNNPEYSSHNDETLHLFSINGKRKWHQGVMCILSIRIFLHVIEWTLTGNFGISRYFFIYTIIPQ